jgi:hypothetical protein
MTSVKRIVIRYVTGTLHSTTACARVEGGHRAHRTTQSRSESVNGLALLSTRGVSLSVIELPSDTVSFSFFRVRRSQPRVLLMTLNGLPIPSGPQRPVADGPDRSAGIRLDTSLHGQMDFKLCTYTVTDFPSRPRVRLLCRSTIIHSCSSPKYILPFRAG